jgi:hypothetical protein
MRNSQLCASTTPQTPKLRESWEPPNMFENPTQSWEPEALPTCARPGFYSAEVESRSQRPRSLQPMRERTRLRWSPGASTCPPHLSYRPPTRPPQEGKDGRLLFPPLMNLPPMPARRARDQISR